MDAIRIETLLAGDRLYLPQLKPLVGKTVEIIVREYSRPTIVRGTSDWNEVKAAVLGLTDYDDDAYREARSAELQQTEQAGP